MDGAEALPAIQCTAGRPHASLVALPAAEVHLLRVVLGHSFFEPPKRREGEVPEVGVVIPCAVAHDLV